MAIICAHHRASALTLIAHSLANHRSLKHHRTTQQKQQLKEDTTLTETWLSCSCPPKTVDTTTHIMPCKCTLFKHRPEKQKGCGSGGVAILLLPQGTKLWEKAGSPDPIS
eukprot:1906789-Ditylum_brightwellii.AAC.1